jgi:hypothetical protein
MVLPLLEFALIRVNIKFYMQCFNFLEIGPSTEVLSLWVSQDSKINFISLPYFLDEIIDTGGHYWNFRNYVR